MAGKMGQNEADDTLKDQIDLIEINLKRAKEKL